MIDRLVVEINKINYTQRQLETYMVLRGVLADSASGPFKMIDESNWSENLYEYKDHMVIAGEALRLSSLQPAETLITTLMNAIAQKKDTDLIFSNFLKSFQISDQELLSHVITIARVDSYIKGRTSKTSQTLVESSQFRNSAWFKRLSSRVPFRIYENARNFNKLQPDQFPMKSSGGQNLLDDSL